VRLLTLTALLFIAVVAPASAATVSGTVHGPRKDAVVAAVSLKTGAVAATATVAKSGRYRLSVPKGPYAVAVRTLRARRITKGVQAPAKGVTATLAAATTGGVTAIGHIPVTIDPSTGLKGGDALGGMVPGLLDACDAKNGKLIDGTPEMQKALQGEARLSGEGRSDLRYNYTPLDPDTVIRGKITIDADGKPVADLEIVDARTGAVIKHIRVGGDKGDVLDLDPFLRQIGRGAGQIACTKPKPVAPTPSPPAKPMPAPIVPPVPAPTPPAAPGPVITARYAGTYSYDYDATDKSGPGVTHLKERFTWDARATVDTRDSSTTTSLTVAQGTIDSNGFEASGTPQGYSCTIGPFSATPVLGWYIQQGNPADTSAAYVSLPRLVGRVLTVTGSGQNCNRFGGSQALSCLANCRSGCLSWPAGPKTDTYEEAESFGRVSVPDEATHHGTTQTLSGDCGYYTVTATRTISGDLTISHAASP
jgi:hypothetical protein